MQDATRIQQTLIPLSKGLAVTDLERSHQLAPGPVDPWAGQRYTNYQYPEAVRGLQETYNEVVLGMITDDVYDVWFRDILPIRKIDSLEVAWDVWQLETPDMDPVPYEGVIKFMSTGKRRESASLSRLGKGIKMELGYFNTQQGRRHFDLQIQSLANGVKRWMAYDTVYALINANKYEAILRVRYGQFPVSFTLVMENEIENFAAISKSWKKIDMVVENAKQALKRNDVVPDTLIVPQELAPHLHLVHDERILYNQAGPSGMANFEQNSDLLGTFRGLMVVQSNFASIYGEEKYLENPLVRRIQIGEYHEMVEKCDQPFKKYSSRRRDIYVYNQDADDLEKLHFKHSLMHCNIWDPRSDDWSQHVLDEHQRYVEEGRRVPMIDELFNTNEDLIYDNLKRRYGKEALPLSVLTVDDNNQWALATLVGHLLPYAVNSKHLHRMAESVLAKFKDNFKHSALTSAFADFKDVVQGIQNQGYNEAYAAALVRANLTRQLNPAGEFVGERTPKIVNPLTGFEYPQLTEWKPNMSGALDLPQIDLSQKDYRGVTHPLGFASGAGLITLEAERDRVGSPWKGLAERIAPVMSLFREIIDLLKNVCPESLALASGTRAPWFHKDDALAIFIDNCYPLNGDPLFLSAVKPSDARGTNAEGEHNVIYYTVIPVGTTVPEAEFKKDLEGSTVVRNVQFELSGAGTVYTWRQPLTGNAVALNVSLLRIPGVAPPYIQIYGHIGSKTAAVYNEIVDALRNSVDDGNRARALEELNKYASRIIKIVNSNSVSPAAAIGATLDKINKGGNPLDVIATFNAAKNTAQLVSFVGDYEAADDTSEKEFNLDALKKSTQEDNFKQLSSKDMKDIEASTDAILKMYNDLLLFKPTQPLPVLNLASKEAALEAVDKIKAIPFGEPNAVNTPSRGNIKVDQLLNALDLTIKRMVTFLPDKVRAVNVPNHLAAETVYSSDTFRAPLVSSLAFLKSIQSIASPLLKPGNPENGFTTPLEAHDTEGGVLPQEIYKRSSYLTIGAAFESGPYNEGNIRYLEGAPSRVESEQPKKRKQKSFGFSDFLAGKKIGAFGGEQDSSYEKDDMETFKRRRNDGAYYSSTLGGSRGSSPIVTKVLTQNFKRIQDKPVLIRMIIHALLMMPINKWSVISRMVDDDLYIPFNVVNWRPFITHEMLSIITMKRGLQTGANFFNDCNLIMQADAAVKTMMANFTFHAKSYVQNKKNVYPTEDVIPYLYKGGCNLDFIDNWEEISEEGVKRKSIIATLCPATETKFPKYATIEGFLPISEINPAQDAQGEAHYWNWEFYAESVYKLSRRSRLSLKHLTFAESTDRINTVCVQGQIVENNPITDHFDVYRPSKGHRGENGNGRGCAAVYNGKQAEFPKFDINEYRLV